MALKHLENCVAQSPSDRAMAMNRLSFRAKGEKSFFVLGETRDFFAPLETTDSQFAASVEPGFDTASLVASSSVI